MNMRKYRLFNNIGLKILSILIAVAMWLLVTNNDDPIKRQQFANIPVTLTHTNLITDNGEVYTVLDNTDVVPSVIVYAKRSVIEALDRENIVATADVKDITSLGTVEIHYYSTKSNNEIESIDGSIENVRLQVEPRRTKVLSLRYQTTGTPADGFDVSQISLDQNQLRVSGPESIVEDISSASVSVDISGATGTISTYSDVRLYEADGGELDTSRLTMNTSSVRVTVTILPVRTVPVQFQVSGAPAAGYLRSDYVSVDPQTIDIMGRSTALSGIDRILIPADEIDISGATEDFTKDVDITAYLPENVSLSSDEFDGMVTVTVGIEAAQNVSLEADISSIVISGVPEGYTAQLVSVTDGSVTLSNTTTGIIRYELSGLEQDVSSVRPADLAAQIDVSQLTAGKAQGSLDGVYTAPVSVTLPEGVSMRNTVTAQVELVEN